MKLLTLLLLITFIDYTDSTCDPPCKEICLHRTENYKCNKIDCSCPKNPDNVIGLFKYEPCEKTSCQAQCFSMDYCMGWCNLFYGCECGQPKGYNRTCKGYEPPGQKVEGIKLE